MTPLELVIMHAKLHKLDVAATVERFSERAAIREYDGGVSRDEAEREAAKEVCGG